MFEKAKDKSAATEFLLLIFKVRSQSEKSLVVEYFLNNFNKEYGIFILKPSLQSLEDRFRRAISLLIFAHKFFIKHNYESSLYYFGRSLGCYFGSIESYFIKLVVRPVDAAKIIDYSRMFSHILKNSFSADTSLIKNRISQMANKRGSPKSQKYFLAQIAAMF